jgi:hypothetical protein
MLKHGLHMLRLLPSRAAAGLVLGLSACVPATAAPAAGAAAGAPARASTHFLVQTMDGPVSDRLQREVLAHLEDWHRRFLIVFESQPATPIPVRLHQASTFHADTGAPSWADGVFASDGAIRVAVGGAARVGHDLDRVLAHELAHAFITHLSAGRAPSWLQEGLAQALTEDGPGASPGAAAADRPGDLDHAGSLGFVRHLLARAGTSGLRDVLADLGAGHPLEQALADRLGAGLGSLFEAWHAGPRTLARRQDEERIP